MLWAWMLDSTVKPFVHVTGFRTMTERRCVKSVAARAVPGGVLGLIRGSGNIEITCRGINGAEVPLTERTEAVISMAISDSSGDQRPRVFHEVKKSLRVHGRVGKHRTLLEYRFFGKKASPLMLGGERVFGGSACSMP